MATEYFNIKGKLKYAKVYEPDSYAGAERWKTNFYPYDGKEWEKVMKSGIQTVPKEDADGKYITLRRDCKKAIKDDLVIFSPPELTGAVEVSYVDDEGNRLRSYNKGDYKGKVSRKGDPVDIGNGTVAIVNFSVYETKQGKGHRLESIRILDLVGYERKEEPTEEEKDEAVKELAVEKDQDTDLPF